MNTKLLILIPSLRGGGTERVILNLLKKFDKEKLDICLVLVKKEGQYIEEVPNYIKVVDLNASRTLTSGISLIKAINSFKPDVILSASMHLNIYLLLIKYFIRKKIKIIIREGSIVSQKISKKNIVAHFFINKFYNKADLIVCQSHYMSNDLIKNYSISDHKIKVIFNPINIEEIQGLYSTEVSPFEEKYINIISVGRLQSVKNHRDLILGFQKFSQKKRNSRLYIIGEGPLKEELQTLIAELEIEGSVFLIDFQKNPYKWMAYADLFILNSKYEGLPNVLLEAIASSAPIIVSKHPGGSYEILEVTHQTNRFVSHLTWEDWWFNRPSIESLKLLKSNFDVNNITHIYEREILKLAGKE